MTNEHKEPRHEFVQVSDDICHVVEKKTKAIITSFRWNGYSRQWGFPLGYHTYNYLTLDACKKAYEKSQKPQPVLVQMVENGPVEKKSS